MITLKEFMEVTNYRITEGSDYCWTCYGHNGYTLDSWNGEHDGYSFSIVFDTKTQVVYEATAYDYTNDRAYRLINPDYTTAHHDEAIRRGIDDSQAWDDVPYTELEVLEDYLEKVRGIISGETYDTRVQVEINFDEGELLQYMKLAHTMDITFNELVEQALINAIEALERGELDHLKVEKADYED
jgi:hypothetical protein